MRGGELVVTVQVAAVTALRGLPVEIQEHVWRLVLGGWALEANRILVQATGDAVLGAAIVAALTRRKLNIHN